MFVSVHWWSVNEGTQGYGMAVLTSRQLSSCIVRGSGSLGRLRLLVLAAREEAWLAVVANRAVGESDHRSTQDVQLI